MILLLLAQPTLPPPPEAIVYAAPVTMPVTLVWSNSTAAGCSNRLYSWTETGTTNIADVGTTNRCTVWQTVNPRTYHYVKAVQNGRESQPSNAVGVPPKKLTTFKTTDFDGKEFWSQTFTNTPPGSMGKAKLGYVEALDYAP